MSVVSLAKNPYRQRRSSARDMARKGPKRSARRSGSAKGPAGGKERSALGAALLLLGRLAAGALFFGLLAAMGIGLLWMYRTATTHPYFGLATMSIEGHRRLEKAEIVALAGVVQGENILAMDLEAVRQRLADDPWVEQANVRRVLPDGLAIDIQEREAVFWVLRGEDLWYADGLGSPIAPVEAQRFAALPLLSLQDATSVELQKLTELLRALRANDVFFGTGEVASMSLEHGGELTVMLESGRHPRGLKLVMAVEHWRRDLRYMDAVLADLSRRGELKTTSAVLAWGETVVVETEAGPTG